MHKPELDRLVGVIEPEIVLANIREVTPKRDETGQVIQVLTPLIPLEDVWFQATLVYDLLRYGVAWATIKQRYGIAKKNPRARIVAYVRERGRKIYDEISWGPGLTTYKFLPAPVHDGL